MHTSHKFVLSVVAISMLGCASTEENDKTTAEKSFSLGKSYLYQQEKNRTKELNEQTTVGESSDVGQSNLDITELEPLSRSGISLRKSELLAVDFSNEPTLTISVNALPLDDFLHYALGELLKVNYIIDKSVKPGKENITLNIQEKISPQRLMQLINELLVEQDININFNDGLYFIHKPEKNKRNVNVVTAVGRELSDVPNTGRDIMQIVPLKYGIKVSIERTLRTLVGVQITTDSDQSALFLQGKREDILRSLEFIHLLDAPANRGKHIGLIDLTFIDNVEFTKQITTLLQNEGINISTDRAGNNNLVMVPIDQIGAVAVFSAEKELLERVRYWAGIIDKPQQSITKQYFLYHPEFARAADLGESISDLLGGTVGKNSLSSGGNTSATGQAPSAKRKTGVQNDEIKLVVDERANAIIFYTSGNEYQALLPLIKKLDVLPRQVMLDITIAEVNLTDEFKHGVEWALQSGDVAYGTKGAFGLENLGGFSLAIEGVDGKFAAKFFETNDLIKVLSNPTILVRDGVAANIKVGSDISVIGQTTEDPLNGERQSTTSEYRKTGVDVSVTPSVNARGIVIMEISQSISNQVPDSAGPGGNPDIFERSLKTEVVAQTGQTILLGGLISENINQNNKKTPWMADIPLLGNLFKSKGDSKNRTELVMLITPRVIDSTDQWQNITEDFKQNLEFLKF